MKNLFKHNLYTHCALAGFILLAVVGCNDYLDVSPKSQILTDEFFSDEGGFFDQLTGVYSQMGSTKLYGRELTFGLAEVLSQNYDMESANDYAEAADYDYDDLAVQAKIDSIWSVSYNCIANLNLMLAYYESADPDIFSANHYDLYRGEALGLRAFLHFELMRTFAASPASNAAADGVPYVTEYAPKVTAQKSVSETMDLVIADLQAAIDYLKVDSLYTSAARYDQDDRRYYFNYYAAKQMLARAYLWNGELTNAALVAEEVIVDYEQDNSPVPWTDYTSLASVPSNQKDRIYEGEMTFRMEIVDMNEVVDPFFTEDAGSNSFYFTEDKVDEFFEVNTKALGNDYRCLYGFEYDGEYQYLWKYHQYGGDYDDMLPVIRRPEIYYIAAEAQKETNPTRAIELLNTVRENRNIDDDDALADDLSADEIQEEVFKEYRKEFLGEGQLFFYYKRLNLSAIEGASQAANNAIYVWPMPDNEIEFGDR